jgi:hypothetical protein
MVGTSGTVSPVGRRAPGRRAALGTSVLLHLSIAWLLQRLSPGGAFDAAHAPAPADPLSISVIETPTPAADRQRRPAAPAKAPLLPKRHPDRARSFGAPDLPAPIVPTAPADADRTRPVEIDPGPKIDLSLAALGNTTKQRVASAFPADEALERLLRPPPDHPGRARSVDQLRADAERRAAAIENVRAGRADPLHFDYLRAARDRLTPDATRLAERLPLGAAESMKGWARGYLGRVDEVNRGAARDVPGSPTDDGMGPRPDVLGAYKEVERQASSGAVERTARVCLGIAPNHDVLVTLGRSSGNAALDRLAVESFRASAEARPVVAEIRPGLACYLVRISAYRVPPTPSISLTWKSGPKVIYPLSRITQVSVELESVDYGPRRE